MSILFIFVLIVLILVFFIVFFSLFLVFSLKKYTSDEIVVKLVKFIDIATLVFLLYGLTVTIFRIIILVKEMF